MGAKPNIRSFRYSDRVLEILSAAPGDSLNEKFENLVLYCHDRKPEVTKQLRALEARIASAQKQLESVQQEIAVRKQQLTRLGKLENAEEELGKALAQVTLQAIQYKEQLKQEL